MKNQLFAALLGVIAFTCGYAQEQLSFVDNHERAIYKTAYFYESDDTVRYLTEENDGTITIAEYNGETFDTIFYQENLDNVPYTSNNFSYGKLAGDEHWELFTHEVCVVNTHTLETRVFPYVKEKEQEYYLRKMGKYLVVDKGFRSSQKFIMDIYTGEIDTFEYRNFIPYNYLFSTAGYFRIVEDSIFL